MDKENLRDEYQPLAPEEQAKLIAEETHGLKRCGRHPVEVFFDGPDDACPACQAAREWLALTDEKF